ncbi:MAG TPA: type III pantothenate kinase [Limnobacter sp.]|uniref:type III pantothenate kinase n=1 Tax=Limnobacter sp. TaxID=2003368 RepID=UPI002EDB0A3D
MTQGPTRGLQGVLLVDAGNTHIKLTRLDSAAWQPALMTDDWPATRISSRAADRMEQIAAQWLGRPPGNVGEVWLCSVLGDEFEQALGHACVQAGIPLRVLRVGDVPWLQTAYAQPQRLGCDRWGLMLAAVHQAVQQACVCPLLCVSLGTATTVDAVLPNTPRPGVWQHPGGFIAPGLQTMLDSLHSNTAQLPRVDLAQASWPTDTASAIGAGVFQMQVDFIHTRRAQLQALTGQSVQCVLAGGGATAMAQALPDAWVLPQAVLQGLCVAFAKS